MKCLRVISRTKEITLNQAEAAEGIDLPILGMHANNKTAKLAEHGDIRNAKITQGKYARIIKENISNEGERKQYNAWNDNNQALFQSPAIIAKEQQQIQQPQFQFPQSNATFQQPQSELNLLQPSQPQPQPFQFPQPPQQVSSIFNTFTNFFTGSSNAATENNSSANNPIYSPQPSSHMSDYDDTINNQIYQNKDHRRNKKQWNGERKY